MWQLAEAKNKFSEVVRRALTEGPQVISRRNDRVVLVSEEEWNRVSGQKKRMPFGQWLVENAPRGEPLPEIERDKSEGREVDLS